MVVRNIKSKYSPEIAQILEQTSAMLAQQAQQQAQLQQMQFQQNMRNQQVNNAYKMMVAGMMPGQMPQGQAVNNRPGRGPFGGDNTLEASPANRPRV